MKKNNKVCINKRFLLFFFFLFIVIAIVALSKLSSSSSLFSFIPHAQTTGPYCYIGDSPPTSNPNLPLCARCDPTASKCQPNQTCTAEQVIFSSSGNTPTFNVCYSGQGQTTQTTVPQTPTASQPTNSSSGVTRRKCDPNLQDCGAGFSCYFDYLGGHRETDDPTCQPCGANGRTCTYSLDEGQDCTDPASFNSYRLCKKGLACTYDIKTDSHICQPCGGENQHEGCPYYIKKPYNSYENYKCNDPQMFVWNDKNLNLPAYSYDYNVCKPLPSKHDLLQYDRTGFELKGQKSVMLRAWYNTNNTDFNIYRKNTDYYNSEQAPDNPDNRQFIIYVDSKKPASDVQNLFFKNASYKFLISLFNLFQIKIDELSEKIDFTTDYSQYTNAKSYLNATCNNTNIQLPVYTGDFFNMASIYASFITDTTSPFIYSGSYFTYFPGDPHLQMGVDAWNKCQFKFNQDNKIVLKNLHLVFNNGGDDIVYDYDFFNVVNNYLNIKFVYTQLIPTKTVSAPSPIPTCGLGLNCGTGINDPLAKRCDEEFTDNKCCPPGYMIDGNKKCFKLPIYCTLYSQYLGNQGKVLYSTGNIINVGDCAVDVNGNYMGCYLNNKISATDGRKCNKFYPYTLQPSDYACLINTSLGKIKIYKDEEAYDMKNNILYKCNFYNSRYHLEVEQNGVTSPPDSSIRILPN